MFAGPTSFAPVIEMGMSIVDESRGQYHVLLIIADGQVTRSVDTPNDQLSIPERQTVDAIVRARWRQPFFTRIEHFLPVSKFKHLFITVTIPCQSLLLALETAHGMS